MRPLLARLALVLALGVLCGAALAQEWPGWWDAHWRRRMLLNFAPDQPHMGAPGAYAWVHLPADADRGGRDLRVVEPNGRPARFGIVHAASEGRYLIAFAARRKQGAYAVYYDNPSAGAIEQELPPRGMFYETRPIPEGATVDSWAGAQRAIAAAGPAYGAAPWRSVFDAYNPFGPQSRYVGIYRGHIRCPKDGRYKFATLSDDSSFLLVDDRVVAQWVGRHNIQRGRRGEHSGTTELKEGLHRFQYVHFSFRQSSRAAAAWQPPGEDGLTIIPRSAFPGLPEARVFASERLDQPLCADFTWRAEQYCEARDAQMVAVRFVSTSTAAGDALIERYLWDFGDGQAASDSQPVHVFLTPGTFDVTLTVASTAGHRISSTKRVRVDRLWEDMNFTLAKEARFWDWTEGYRLDRLPTASLLAAWEFAKHRETTQRAAEAAQELYERRDELEPVQLHDVAMALGAYRQEAGRRPAEARRYFEAARDAVPEADRRRRFEARFALCDHYLYFAEDTDRARREYAKLRADFPQADPARRRLALVRIGDTHRCQGNREKATDVYREAEGDPAFAPKEPRAVVAGAGLHQVRSYLRRGEGEAALKRLEELLWAYPTMRLEGEPAALRVQAELVTGDFAEAKKQAEAFIGFSKDPNHLPSLHVAAAEACVELGLTDEAAEHYRTVLEDFPEAPEVQDARNGLHRLGQ